MDNLYDTTPEGDEPAPAPSLEDAFSSMESALDNLPEGEVITLRHEANPPMYVGLAEGEQGLTVKEAAHRRGLTFGSQINVYVDGNAITLDTFVAAGTVVTLVGQVKGG